MTGMNELHFFFLSPSWCEGIEDIDTYQAGKNGWKGMVVLRWRHDKRIIRMKPLLHCTTIQKICRFACKYFPHRGSIVLTCQVLMQQRPWGSKALSHLRSPLAALWLYSFISGSSLSSFCRIFVFLASFRKPSSTHTKYISFCCFQSWFQVWYSLVHVICFSYPSQCNTSSHA